MHEKESVAGSDAGKDSLSTEEPSGESERPPPDSKPVAVLFGTEYGFSKEIAEKAAAQLKEGGKYW